MCDKHDNHPNNKSFMKQQPYLIPLTRILQNQNYIACGKLIYTDQCNYHE